MLGFDRRIEATYRRHAMHGAGAARRLGKVAVVFVAVLGHTDARAQDTSGARQTSPAAKEPTVDAKRQDALTQTEREKQRLTRLDAASIPAAEKKVRARKMIEDQKVARDRASSLYGESQSRNDMLQANCVSDKLTQIKGLLRVSQRAEATMVSALDANKSDEANHSFNQITLAHQRSGQLRAEAEQCVGELSVFTGDTEVEVQIDSSIPRLDPTQPVLAPPGPQTPPLASDVDGDF